MPTSQILDIVALLCTIAAAVGAILVGRRIFARGVADARFEAAEKGVEMPTPRGPLRVLVGPLAAALRPASQHDLDKLVTRLQNAGRRARDEVDRFTEERVIFMFLGLILGGLVGPLLGGMPGFFAFFVFLLIGYMGAQKIVDSQAEKRQQAVSRSLPGAVDLLVTCLDAGLSLEKAVSRVAADLSHSEPILAEELRITASEFEAGVSLADALRRLARRVGIDELSAMCGVIAQASALGAPIAQTLRDYALQSRKQRISMLEERAGKLTTQLTLPLALCLLPAALLIILGPAAVQLVGALK